MFRDRKNRKRKFSLVFGYWLLGAVFIPVLFFTLSIAFPLANEGSRLYSLAQWIHSVVCLAGANNVAMTIGTTGIVFTWLVPILERRECGVTIDEILNYKFRNYPLIIIFLSMEVVVCIYLSSYWENMCNTPEEITFCIFGLLVGIVVSTVSMFYLCWEFLFFSHKRRRLAFEYLEHQITVKRRGQNNLNPSIILECREVTCWSDEIGYCLQNHEDEYIKRFLDCLCGLFPRRGKLDPKYWMSECRDVFSRIVENTPEYLLLSFPNYFPFPRGGALSSEDSECPDKFIWLLLCYIFSVSDMYARIDKNTLPEWCKTRLHYVWYRIVGGAVDRNEVVSPHLLLAIFAYEAIFPVRTAQEVESFFTLLQRTTIAGTVSSGLCQTYRSNILLIAKNLCNKNEIIGDRRAARRFSWLITNYFQVEE